MEFRRIEYFLVLADKLSFAKAAKELCISSQALTKQINILESELGTRLFKRTTRSVELTEDGDTIARHNFFDDCISETESFQVANDVREGDWEDFFEDW